MNPRRDRELPEWRGPVRQPSHRKDLLFAALGCFALAAACVAILIALNRR